MAPDKLKSDVRYRPAPAQAREQCRNCAMFTHATGRMGRCSLVIGEIDGEYVCDRWEPKR